MRRRPLAVQQIFDWVRSGFLQILPVGEEAAVWIMTFLRKYQRVHPQLADACLVYLAEQHDLESMFTLDRRDFSTYRYGRNRSLRLLPE